MVIDHIPNSDSESRTGKYWKERYKDSGISTKTNKLERVLYWLNQGLRVRAVSKVLARAQIDIKEETQVLEVGCGPGDFIGLMVAKGATITGMDINPTLVSMLNKRFERNSKVRVFEGKAQEMHLSPSYDLIVSMNVLECIPDDNSLLLAIQNMTNAVRSGGHILLQEISPRGPPVKRELDTITIRTRQEWINAFQDTGCYLVHEFVYPQWGILGVGLMSYLFKLLPRNWGRGQQTSHKLLNRDRGTGQQASRILHYLVDIMRIIIQGLALPLDYLLYIPSPSAISKSRILIFRKP